VYHSVASCLVDSCIFPVFAQGQSALTARCAGNPHPLRGKSSPAAREILTRCAGNPKSEIRNPKSERKPKCKYQNAKPFISHLGFGVLDLEFEFSFGFRISDFGFRISDFPRSG